MPLKAIPLLLALHLCFSASSQTGNLSGIITAEGQVLTGANLYLPDLEMGTSSAADGSYRIAGIPAGTHQLQASAIGHRSVVVEVEIRSGMEAMLDITLPPDPLSLEQVVVTGTRTELSRYQAPVIVATLGSRTFESTQSLSLSEGLSFSPGLRLENNCQNCGFTQLRMNGLEGAYSQILINSRPIFSALAGVYGLDMLPVNMVDRVEIVRGGGSALYGGSAIAGTVNIITKDPVLNAFEVGFNQSYTGLEQPDRTLTFNGSLVADGLEKGISFFGYHRSRQPWDANGDGFSELVLLRNHTIGFDAFWKPGERSKVKAGVYAINEFRRGGNAFDRQPHQADLAEQLAHRILGTHTSYERYSLDLRHKLALYASAQFVQRDSYYGAGGRVLQPGDSLTQTDLLALNAYGRSSDASVVGGAQYSFEISKGILLTAGTEAQANTVADAMPGYGRYVDQSVATLGSYTQLELKPTTRLTLLLGGRFDHVRNHGTHRLGSDSHTDRLVLNVPVPRLSAMYTLAEGLKLRGSYAQGYRAPQAFDEDLHLETVGGTVRFVRLAADLATERSASYTASAEYSRWFGKVQTNFVAEGFYTALHNPFVLADHELLPGGIAIITKRNGDGAYVQGMNLEANAAFTSRLIVQTGATVQSARYTTEETLWSPEDGDDPLPPVTTTHLLRTPDVYGYATVLYSPVPKKLTLSWSGVYTGRMTVPHVTGPENGYTELKRTPAFFENNLRVAYTRQGKDSYRIQLFCGVHNLFNSFQRDFDTGPGRDAGYVYGPSRPRTVFAGVKIGYN